MPGHLPGNVENNLCSSNLLHFFGFSKTNLKLDNNGYYTQGESPDLGIFKLYYCVIGSKLMDSGYYRLICLDFLPSEQRRHFVNPIG